jgi:putative transposase
MSKSKHSEAEMIGALKQLEAGRKAEDVAREVGVSKHTIYAWKAKYGGRVARPASMCGRGLRLFGCRILRFVKGAGVDLQALRFALPAYTLARDPAARRNAVRVWGAGRWRVRCAPFAKTAKDAAPEKETQKPSQLPRQLP